MARKKLNVPDEQFFMTCALVFGPPLPYKPSEYITTNPTVPHRFSQGFGFWLAETDMGKLWLKLVTEGGEAKARAGKLYYRYCQWYRKQPNGPEDAGGSRGDSLQPKTTHES